MSPSSSKTARAVAPQESFSPFWASASGPQLRSRAVRGLRSQLAVREAGRAAPPLLRHPAGQRQAAEPVGQWGRRQLSPHHPWQLAAVADCYLPVPPLLCRAAGEGCPSQLWNIRLQPSLRRHGRSTSHTGQIAAAPNASPLSQQRTRSVLLGKWRCVPETDLVVVTPPGRRSGHLPQTRATDKLNLGPDVGAV
jgi:hypothetical protein